MHSAKHLSQRRTTTNKQAKRAVATAEKAIAQAAQAMGMRGMLTKDRIMEERDRRSAKGPIPITRSKFTN